MSDCGCRSGRVVVPAYSEGRAMRIIVYPICMVVTIIRRVLGVEPIPAPSAEEYGWRA